MIFSDLSDLPVTTYGFLEAPRVPNEAFHKPPELLRSIFTNFFLFHVFGDEKLINNTFKSLRPPCDHLGAPRGPRSDKGYLQLSNRQYEGLILV